MQFCGRKCASVRRLWLVYCREKEWERDIKREGVWWSAVCTCLCWCAHSNRLVSVCMCVKVCHHFAQLENLLFTTTKQCCLFFFLLYCNLLCFLCFLFTSCTCSLTHTHTYSCWAFCMHCVCVWVQTRNWNWVIGANARALFFSFVSFAASNLLLSPSHLPLSLAQSSCFCYALVTVRKLQLLLWLRVGGNDQQMTNFILCHLMMTTSAHKIQQEQGGERERETKPVLVAANFWRWRHSCRAAAPPALLLLLVLLRFMFYAGNKKPRKKAAPKRFTSAAPTALIPFFLFPFPPTTVV